MKRLIIFLIGLGLILIPTQGFAQAKDQAQEKKIEVGNKICPVMGNKIVEGQEVKVEYKGKIYNLCCPGCVEEFFKDPEKYIHIVDESMKAGKEKTNP